MPTNDDRTLPDRSTGTVYQPAHHGGRWAERDLDSRRNDAVMDVACWQLSATWWPDDEHLLVAQLSDSVGHPTCLCDVARRWDLQPWDADGTAFGPACGISATVTRTAVALTASRLLWAHTARPGLWRPDRRCQLLVMHTLPDPGTDPVLALLERTYDGPAYLGDLAVTHLP